VLDGETMEEVETTLEDLAAMAAVVDTVEAVVEEAASAVVTAIVEAAEVVEVTEEAEAAMVVTTIVEAAEAEVTEGVAVVIKKGIAIATATPEVMPGVVIRLGELDQVQPEVMTTKEVEVLIKKTRAEEATALAVDLAHPTRKAEQALIQPLNRTLTKTILQATEECVVDKDSEEAVEEVALTLQTQPVLPEAPAQFT
jgi:hypothetical protein